MRTVLETTETRKPAKAFYAHLDATAGALTKVHGTLYFIAEDGTITEIQPSMINFLCVLGEMTLADSQRLNDLLDGGYARVACQRRQEVA